MKITPPGKPLTMMTLCLLFMGSGAAYADPRDIVRTQDGSVIRNSFGYCVRTQWTKEDDACGPRNKAEYHKHRTLAEEDRTVYFDFNKATLTPSAKAKLDSLANAIVSEQDVKEARIIGYADRMGSSSYNEALSKKRADNVRKYLISKKVVNARVAETRWFGETTPVTTCPATLKRARLIECLQKDRRVEVEIDYLPEGKAMERR